MKSGNTVLANHLKTAPKNLTYTSKTTQNELIECIGDHIRDNIIHEINKLNIIPFLIMRLLMYPAKSK